MASGGRTTPSFGWGGRFSKPTAHMVPCVTTGRSCMVNLIINHSRPWQSPCMHLHRRGRKTEAQRARRRNMFHCCIILLSIGLSRLLQRWSRQFLNQWLQGVCNYMSFPGLLVALHVVIMLSCVPSSSLLYRVYQYACCFCGCMKLNFCPLGLFPDFMCSRCMIRRMARRVAPLVASGKSIRMCRN